MLSFFRISLRFCCCSSVFPLDISASALHIKKLLLQQLFDSYTKISLILYAIVVALVAVVTVFCAYCCFFTLLFLLLLFYGIIRISLFHAYLTFFHPRSLLLFGCCYVCVNESELYICIQCVFIL